MPLVRKTNKRYTYQDYLEWPDDERWELIEGEAYDMNPAPKTKHQDISRNLSWSVANQKEKLQEKGCKLYEAPTDVVFDEYNVVQPDIFIVCDKKKITEDNIQGAPDLIIEIISKSTAYKDIKIKKDLYERFGVEEYIIVFPELEIVERYLLEDNKYPTLERFNWDEALKLRTLNIEINLWEVFEKELPEVTQDRAV